MILPMSLMSLVSLVGQSVTRWRGPQSSPRDLRPSFSSLRDYRCLVPHDVDKNDNDTGKWKPNKSCARQTSVHIFPQQEMRKRHDLALVNP